MSVLHPELPTYDQLKKETARDQRGMLKAWMNQYRDYKADLEDMGLDDHGVDYTSGMLIRVIIMMRLLWKDKKVYIHHSRTKLIERHPGGTTGPKRSLPLEEYYQRLVNEYMRDIV